MNRSAEAIAADRVTTSAVGEPPPETTEQRAVIDARDRDVFCEAGAGSGKTRVLVERYCEAIATDEVDMERVLAFTFTERAAAELRRRVRRELGRRARAAKSAGDASRARELASLARATERAWVMTIHALCRRLLASHPLAAGLDPRFRVLDEAESGRLRERAIADALASLSEQADETLARALAAYRPWRIGQMAVAAHERLRSQGMSVPRLPDVPDPIRSIKKGDDASPLDPSEAEAAGAARAALEALLEAFAARYEELKLARSALDFADLELRALELLRSSEAVRSQWQGRFAHLMVDEFQDTNRVQLDLVEALRDSDTRLFVVGDENQSIYRFRNADLEVFRAERARASADPGTAVLPLRGNFRSSAPVLGAINELGAALLDRFEPLVGQGDDVAGASAELLLTLDEGRGRHAVKWAPFAETLEPPPSETSMSIVAEARALAQRLRELVDGGEAARGEIVVLLRAFTHVDAYDEALARAGLDPYVVGGRGYWSQQQVEDLIRLLAAISNPLDDEMLFGALASPAAGVSPDALWLLRRAAGEGNHVWPTVEWSFGGSERAPGELADEWLEAIDDRDRTRLERFCRILSQLRAEAPVTSLEALIERAMSAFGYDLELLARPDGTARMANVRKLMRLAREFERHEGRDLAGFLAAAEASTRRDEREGMAPVNAEGHDGVRVMTVHAAKGLEFPVIAVPDLGRGLNAGHRGGDVVIGSISVDGAPAGFGMRLAFPSEKSLGLWELHALSDEESAAESEEGCRLVYVAATRAERRLLLSGIFKPSDLEQAEEPKANDSPLRRLLPRLAARGFDGEDGALELPTPLAVRVSRPSEERASVLARRIDPAARAEPVGEDAEPLGPIDHGPRPVPVGHLSYSTLADYERCGYRFYAERVLGLAPGGLAPTAAGGSDDRVASDADPERTPDEIAEPPAGEAAWGADPRSRSLGFGNAVHAALEWSAGNRWSEPSEELYRTFLGGEHADGEAEIERAQSLVRGWLASELFEELARAETRPEVPFALPLGGIIVRGKIDLLARIPRGAVVVDFKTDALGGRPVAELGERYRAQRELYALVAADDARAGSVQAIHLFLEAPGEPVVEELGPLELEAARKRLEGLIERIRGGDFVPTETPSQAICFGCPAAWNLCPHPKWRPRS